MKVFYTDRKKEFISVKLKNICNQKGIVIKYFVFYILKKNELPKQG